MDMKQLATFTTLCQTLNYKNAAEQLQYAPSTLFKHIQLLEQELGAPLFCKTGRQLQLTEKGKIFQEHAGRILDSYHQAMSSIAGYGGTEAAMNIGGCEINTANSLLGLFMRFSQSHKDVKMNMLTLPNANVPALVRSEAIDLGYVYSVGEKTYPGLQAQTLYQEAVYVMIAKDDPLAARRHVKYEDLQGMDFVYPHDSCCFVTELLQRLSRRGVRLGKIGYMGGVHLVVEQMHSGGVLTLAPQCALGRYVETYGLTKIDLDEEPVWARETILCKNYEAMGATARALWQHSLRYARRMIQEDETGMLCAVE